MRGPPLSWGASDCTTTGESGFAVVAPERFGAGDAMGPGLGLSLHDGINGDMGLASGMLRALRWFLNFKGGAGAGP